MLYVRQDNEDVYTALHVVPPTTNGLISAVSERLAVIKIKLSIEIYWSRYELSFNVSNTPKHKRLTHKNMFRIRVSTHAIAAC